MNIAKTGLLLAAMTALFPALGFMVGGKMGMVLAGAGRGASVVGPWG